MTRYRTVPYPIAQLHKLKQQGRLEIQPKFQRRAVWPTQAASFLIDTIIQGIPMPKIYLRDLRDRSVEKHVLQAVDGQQRLRSIFSFVDGEFSLLPEHNEKYSGLTFGALPSSVQRQLLEYQITAEVLEDASDEDVWRLFWRLNRYTVRINPQETRHARFIGEFKNEVYRLSDEHIREYRLLSVISQLQYSRMREAELTSDILVAMVDGISDITALDDKYEQYESEFPDRERVSDLFSRTFKYLVDEFTEPIKQTKFSNHAWFYSLMVSAADALEGVPGGYGPTSAVGVNTIAGRMRSLDHDLRQPDLEGPLSRLNNSLTRATSHVPERKIRHEHFYKLLTD